MPPEIEAMFLWLEEVGFVHTYLNSDKRFANLYPNHLIETGGAFAQFIKVENDRKCPEPQNFNEVVHEW